MTVATEALGTIRRIGPIRVNPGNHRAAWTGAPTQFGRELSIGGTFREPDSGRAMLELVENRERRVQYGPHVGVLEWIDSWGQYAEMGGWALLTSYTYNDGPADPDSDIGWSPFTLSAIVLGHVTPSLVREARALPNDFEIVARSLVVQPLEGDDAMGHPFVVDPAAGAGLVLAGYNETQDYGTDGGTNGLAGTGDIALASGDISLRVAIVPHDPDQDSGDLFAQWREPDQHSYLMQLHQNTILVLWSTDGTNVLTEQSDDLGLSVGDAVILRWDLDGSERHHWMKRKSVGRGDLRTQMFEETGWTTIYEDDDAGSTSIFNSGTGLKIGGYLDANLLSRSRFKGRILGAMLVDGLDTTTGTVKVDPDFTIQPSATTAFLDQTGNLWIADNNEVAYIGSQPFDREYDPATEYDPDVLSSLGRRLRLHQGKVV